MLFNLALIPERWNVSNKTIRRLRDGSNVPTVLISDISTSQISRATKARLDTAIKVKKLQVYTKNINSKLVSF